MNLLTIRGFIGTILLFCMYYFLKKIRLKIISGFLCPDIQHKSQDILTILNDEYSSKFNKLLDEKGISIDN